MQKTDPAVEAQPVPESSAGMSRREMLKRALMAGALIPQGFEGGRGRRRGSARTIDPSQIPAYKFRTLPVSYFPRLLSEFERFCNGSQLSRNKAFRDELAPLSFKLPGDFTGARSVVVVAAFAKPMYANFHLDGRPYRILIPPQYYNDVLNAESLKNVVQNEIIKNARARVVDISERVPLKLLAARSGLGRYGRNNLIFVDGMGSYNLLYAFLTDYSLPDNAWSELYVMDRCNHCRDCDRICPTDCIPRGSFVINIDRCLTLYNENAGQFPNWLLRGTHHALMGCLKCQSRCPENAEIAALSGNLEDISEDETRRILEGKPDDALLKSLQRKLKRFPAAASREAFPILTRNLTALVGG